jgi:hypothetical protein
MRRNGSDSYDTCRAGYEAIERFVPLGIRIIDPFFNGGVALAYMEEALPGRTIIHENRDAFGLDIRERADLVLSNPPFSQKYGVLDWLLDLDVPFMLLLPINVMASKRFRKISKFHRIQYIIPNGRVGFEREGYKLTPWFSVCWYCYRLDLPERLNYG